jgi:hypothetical protein
VACELPTPVSATDVAIAVVAVADAENCYNLVFNISLKN